MNVEDELSGSLAEAMKQTIDFDVLCDVLIRFDWTVVEVEYYNGDGDTLHRWVDVMKWVDENCTGKHQNHLGKWIFELEKDAVMFKLKWA